MSAKENTALIRRLFEEGINQNKPGVFDELLAPNFRVYGGPSELQTSPGPEGFRHGFEIFRKAFPDIHVTFEAEFTDGDYVFHRGYVTGTQTGEFQGIPPTGKKVKIYTLDIWHVANGQAVENWVQMDLLSLMQQLGVVPAPAQAH